MEFRNGVRMCKDKRKAGPLGMSRNEAFSLPEGWGGSDFLLPIDVGPIKELKKAMGGDSILDFVSAEFGAHALATYDGLGITQLTMQNVWTVFQDLFNELYP